MKPLQTKIFLVQGLLAAAAAYFVFLTFTIPDTQISFWHAEWGSLKHGEMQIPLILGVISFHNLVFFLNSLFLYLLFELYGFKHAIVTALSLSVMMVLHYYLFFGLHEFDAVQGNPLFTDITPILSGTSQNQVLSTSGAYSLGMISTFILSWCLRKLTKNHLMFLRFVLSNTVGLTVFFALRHWFVNFQNLAPTSIFIDAITPGLQFLALTVLSVFPLYFLRFLFGLFRGKKNDDDWDVSEKTLFKTSNHHSEQEITHNRSLDETKITDSSDFDSDDPEDITYD